MPTITIRDDAEFYCKDWGKGRPVVFSHGWPLNADSWESQMLFLASKGERPSHLRSRLLRRPVTTATSTPSARSAS